MRHMVKHFVSCKMTNELVIVINQTHFSYITLALLNHTHKTCENKTQCHTSNPVVKASA